MVRGLNIGGVKICHLLQSAEADIVCVDAVSTAVLLWYHTLATPKIAKIEQRPNQKGDYCERFHHRTDIEIGIGARR